MRKHDVRKWLHAILDLLPVILIPVFMIYSHRHDIDGSQVQVSESLKVDFNQLQLNGNFETVDNWITPNTNTITADNNTLTLVVNDTSISSGRYCQDSAINYYATHKYYFKYETYFSTNSFSTFRLVRTGVYAVLESHRVNYTGSWQNVEFIYDCLSNDVAYPVFVFDNLDSISLRNFQIFDLTQMFGSGNEPTIQEFNQWFTDDYYAYNLSQEYWIDNYNVITFDDSDIMSQMMYQLYNSVDKYFNMNNVFNMNGVYQWFVHNIFNGYAPMSIYIVWNIVLYEFVMDLLFLLYGLFMWFIDMVEKLMEKPLKSVK